MTDLVYLGPEGTFTHQAALALAPWDARLVAQPDLEAVLQALMSGAAGYAVAAETSAAGAIEATVQLIASGRAQVLARHAISVSFDLYRRRGDSAPLAGVYGHEKALAQISPWIKAHGLQTRVLASNTAGLAAVRDGGEPGWGAAGPPGLAAKYDLEVADQALEGPARNETVFVLLSRSSAAQKKGTP
jgi:prephenate dehydratase